MWSVILLILLLIVQADLYRIIDKDIDVGRWGMSDAS